MTEEHQKEVVIGNKSGLHARTAAVFVREASKYNCEVLVQKKEKIINGKSIMALLLLAACQGTRLTVLTKGQDAAVAIEQLAGLIERGFNEGQ